MNITLIGKPIQKQIKRERSSEGVVSRTLIVLCKDTERNGTFTVYITQDTTYMYEELFSSIDEEFTFSGYLTKDNKFIAKHIVSPSMGCIYRTV